MNRINSSHQTLAAKQRNCNYHPSGAIAQHVLDATVERQSTEAIIVEDGQFLVASAKFAHRYYTVTEQGGTWACSAKDSTVAAKCINAVMMHQAQEAA